MSKAKVMPYPPKTYNLKNPVKSGAVNEQSTRLEPSRNIPTRILNRVIVLEKEQNFSP